MLLAACLRTDVSLADVPAVRGGEYLGCDPQPSLYLPADRPGAACAKAKKVVRDQPRSVGAVMGAQIRRASAGNPSWVMAMTYCTHATTHLSGAQYTGAAHGANNAAPPWQVGSPAFCCQEVAGAPCQMSTFEAPATFLGGIRSEASHPYGKGAKLLIL